MRRRIPRKRLLDQDPWLTRLRFATMRFRSPFGLGSLGRGVVAPELSSSEIPEPDEELPDSDLSDNERHAAIERERWRRHGRGQT